MNNDALNICVQGLCEHTFPSLLSIHLVVEMPSCMVTLFNFLRIYQVVFQSGCTILHFQKQSKKASNFFTSSPTLFIVLCSDYSISSGCKVMCHCGFDLHFPDD